ncbi:hypothetical protein V2J09_016639, partial [Rumex salicifolius]
SILSYQNDNRNYCFLANLPSLSLFKRKCVFIEQPPKHKSLLVVRSVSRPALMYFEISPPFQIDLHSNPQIERKRIHLLLRENNPLMSYCYKEKKPCVGWVQTYFNDCLCNLPDRLSFGLGLVSLLAWALAEVPQIVTNFQTKSSHGISILFLITWVLGDVFNLAGCLLEPATLPTQYYTAVFYTVTTLALVSQSVYYDHFYPWWKCRERRAKLTQQDEEEKTLLNPNNAVGEDEETGGRGIPIPGTAKSELPRPHTASKEFYYTSARSLAGSNTPPFRSYMRAAKSGTSAMALGDHYSSEDDNNNENRNESNSPAVRMHSRSIPCLVAQGASLATAFSLIGQSRAMAVGHKGFTRIPILQERDVEYSGFGQLLGWMMAAIYMGGRIPQIALNIKRGSVEGLNPLMFIFALLGNITYVASILVRNSEWGKIKANLPWLLDAVVCVVLDLFVSSYYSFATEFLHDTRILLFKLYLRKKDSDGNEGEEDYYVEVNRKAFLLGAYWKCVLGQVRLDAYSVKGCLALSPWAQTQSWTKNKSQCIVIHKS